MTKKFTRRDFIKGGIILVGSGIVAALTHLFKPASFQNISTPVKSTDVYTPLAFKEPGQVATITPSPTLNPTSSSTSSPVENATPNPTATERPTVEEPTSLTGLPGDAGAKFPGRVVQVRHGAVHDWNYSDLNYWDSINQSVMDGMVDEGLMSLTGESNLTDAWLALLPNYQSGQVVAIKVSFNNSHDEVGSIEEIDGLIQPVNSIIRGLNTIGVPDSSIVVYDSSRCLPTRFINGCNYSGVVFRCQNHDPWGAGSSELQFTPPGVSAFTQQLSREVAQANYLINVPVLKAHGMTQMSLAMKNHYGSIERPKDLHQWSSLGSPDYSDNYNPIVEINKSTHIRDKTILTVGDSIFAAFRNFDVRSFPKAWITFGNETPKSLFFATDPVAIDCVMGDTLSVEKAALGRGEINPKGFAYLSLAELNGLGVFERGNPWQNNYSKIEFIKREL